MAAALAAKRRLLCWLCVSMLLCSFVPTVTGQNWALPSGPKLSNAVIIAETRWQPRWGAATAVVLNPPANDEVVQSEADKSRIYYMGGDDHNIHVGGGKLYNDVWSTTGTNWEIVENHVSRTLWDEPTPSIASKLRWTPVSGMKVPLDEQNYREWLCCTASWACESKACEDTVDSSEIRWSPRRSHGAVALDKDIFVMGGRARALEDIPEDQAIGSIVGERAIWRETSMLMADVWRSPDGVNWFLVNDGCYVQQRDLLYKGVGVPFGRCQSNADCQNQKLGDTECEDGWCACRHWGPRERFGLVAFKDHLWVVGGVTHVQRQLCGEPSCGYDYRTVLNDVWRSRDGVDWDIITLDSGFPARGDFGLVAGGGQLWVAGGRYANSRDFTENTLFNDVWSSPNGKEWSLNTTSAAWEPRCMFSMAYNEDKLVIFGGMSKLPPPPPPPVQTPAEKAASAAVNAPTDRSGGAAAATAAAAAAEEAYEEINGDRMVMLEEVWTWKTNEGGAEWEMDFDNHTAGMWYIRPSSPLWSMDEIGRLDREALESLGITTVEEVAAMDTDTVLAAKELVPDVCQYRANAMRIIQDCKVADVTFDGQDYRSIEIVEGDSAAEEYVSSLIPEEAPDDDGYEPEDTSGCDVEIAEGLSWDEEAVDVVCRWSPENRRHAPSAVLNNQFYIFGGLIGPDNFGHDVWVRDDHMPTTFITVQPAHESSETVFDFTCDEAGCLFEYRFVNIEDDEPFIERNWTLAKPPIDFLEWAPGAIYRFEVRAIDPSGNKDPTYDVGRNAYVWEYIPALPVLLIVMLTLLFIALSTGGYLEWRRRRKKKAMERYAIKRMRRKFKGIAKDAKGADVDWRQYYEESKAGAKGKALAKQMAEELEKQAGGKTKKKKGKKDKKGKKGKGRGKGKKGKKDKKKKGKGKDKKKKGKDKKKKGKDKKTKDKKKKGKDKKKKGKDKKKKGKKKK